jgi:DNA-binding CsgD family transcriptional regulator
MDVESQAGGSASGLVDRRRERDVLDGLLEAVRAGESRALLLRGDPGVGKTALMDYLALRARGFRVARVTGVQSEMELAFAGLHRLCSPITDRLDRLPAPQQAALQTAFGISSGPPPDRFLVGLAALNVLASVAEERPLVCLIDDEQWLDRASVQALGFAARRLAADPVAVVFAARARGDELVGLPELDVTGLPEDHARALLDSALPVPLDARVRDLIIAESRGNPLALLEIPRTLSPTELAGGFGLPRAGRISGVEEGFRRQLEGLPPQSRRLLQVAAADPSGDPVLVRRAAARLGIPVQAGEVLGQAGLLRFGVQVQFRHPLVRSAAYGSASAQDRQEVHGALAAVTDQAADPDRRAWHRAQAAAGPDDDVAAELESSAGRARARGGLAAAAAFLERSVLLTADPARHAHRTLTAAEANLHAGAFAKAPDLLVTAEVGPLDELARARVDLLRGQIAFAAGRGDDGPRLLVKAAKRLEPLDLELARDTYLGVWMAASFAGPLTGSVHLREVSRAARALPPARRPRPTDLLLEGLALLLTEGRAAAAPALRQAVDGFVEGDGASESRLGRGWMAACLLWDDVAARAIMARQVQLARAAGALDQLPIDLIALAMSVAWTGDLATVDALVAEADAIREITGTHIAPYGEMLLAGLRGDGPALDRLTETAVAEPGPGGQEAADAYARWVAAILHNGCGRYADALAAADHARQGGHLYVSMWALPEVVEAAARTGNAQVAADAVESLAEASRAGGTDWGLGVEARSRALVTAGRTAEGCYREAVHRLGRTSLRPELARAHLLYGEWLRRHGRPMDARAQLRSAHEIFQIVGMGAFAERARRELLATGETVRKRTVPAPSTLTAQEVSVAGLAMDGLTNAEIGARLFLSARTVEWHLRKVFTKLGISSRRELRRTPSALA